MESLTPHPHRSAARAGEFGFSLVEMLVVLAVTAVLMAMIVPAISSMGASWRLTQAGSALRGQLQLARQLSVSRNLNVVVSLAKQAEQSGATQFNTIILEYHKPDGKTEQAARTVVLPAGYAIADQADWSSIMTRTLTNVTNAGKTLPCVQIQYRPGGSLALNSATNWFLTVHRAGVESGPDRNFITLQLDPVTGTVKAFQP